MVAIEELYFRSHVTGSVVGRTGTTIDWQRSLPDGIPPDWNDFPEPPMGSDWRRFLPERPHIVARNAVRPFAIYHDCQSNLVMLSQQAITLLGRHLEGSCSDVRTGEISFGKRTLPYNFARLRHEFLWGNTDNCALIFPQSKFFRVDRKDYEVHGAKIARGEAAIEDCPAPHESGVICADPDAFFAAWASLESMQPENLALALFELPALFSIDSRLYARLDVAMPLGCLHEPGIAFPYRPITVQLVR